MTLSANVTSRTCCAEVIECYVALWAKLNKKVSNKTQQTRHSIQKCRRPSFGRIKQSHKVDYYYFSKIQRKTYGLYLFISTYKYSEHSIYTDYVYAKVFILILASDSGVCHGIVLRIRTCLNIWWRPITGFNQELCRVRGSSSVCLSFIYKLRKQRLFVVFYL